MVLTPLYEEFAFRGVILDFCARLFSFRWANVIQALLFALLHDELPLAPTLFLIGWVAGLLRKRSRGLLMPVLLHAGNNLVVVLGMFWLGVLE